MDFEIGPAIAAGLVGGGVMIMMLYAGIVMMPKQMRMNLLLMLGTMMGFSGSMAYIVGLMMHMGASVGFGIAHAAVFATGDIEDLVLVWGIAFGLAHALISGMMLTMMPAMHPEMRSGRMEAPGFMALGLGIPTGMGFMMLHGVFGALVGVLYSVWI